MKPVLSIIIPSSGRPSECEELLCALPETDGIEILVIENGNDPDLQARYLQLAGEGKCKVLSITESNACQARNYGLQEARGEWVWFCDDDDRPTKSAVISLLKHIEDFPETDIFLLPYYRVSPSQVAGRVRTPDDQPHSYEQYRRYGHYGNSSVAVIKAAAIRSIGGWDNNLIAGQDTDLFLRLSRERLRYRGVHCDPIILREELSGRLTDDSYRQWRGKVQFIRKHWRNLSFARLLRYLAAVASLYPFYKWVLFQRRISK